MTKYKLYRKVIEQQKLIDALKKLVSMAERISMMDYIKQLPVEEGDNEV